METRSINFTVSSIKAANKYFKNQSFEMDEAHEEVKTNGE